MSSSILSPRLAENKVSLLDLAKAEYERRESVRRDTKAKAFINTVQKVLGVTLNLADVQFCANADGEQVPYVEIDGLNFARNGEAGLSLLLACRCNQCKAAHRVVISELADVGNVVANGHLCNGCQEKAESL